MDNKAIGIDLGTKFNWSLTIDANTSYSICNPYTRAGDMPPNSNSKILVVEDDPRLCESIRYLLELHGFDVQAQTNVTGALASLSEETYDLVVLDLNLKNRSGFEIMNDLRERKLDTRVIIMTGLGSEKKAMKALRKGAVDYFRKPFEPEAFLQSINNALGMREHQRAQDQYNQTIVSSRERYRNVVDNQKDFLCRLNSQFDITFVNKTYADYCGYSPRTMIGQALNEFIHHSALQPLFNKLADVRSGSTPATVEYQLVDKDGHPRWRQWQLQGILNDNGELFEIQCVGRDVTRSKLQTEEIEEKKEKYRHLAEITSDWIWEVDHRCVYTYASPVVYELLGYQPEEVVGKRPFDFMPSEEARRLEIVLQKTMAEGQPIRAVENINLHKHGTRITLETSGVPIFDDSGVVTGYRGIDRNISARKLVEKSLQNESRKLKNALGKVKLLSGLLPICASCKMIRDDKGYWNQIETYIKKHSEADFSHGICPQCAKEFYPEYYQEKEV